jgi:hypothetical protein
MRTNVELERILQLLLKGRKQHGFSPEPDVKV